MIGKRSSFAALLKKKIPDIIVKHCFLHRHALTAKTLLPNLKDVLSICVQAVNFIRGRFLDHRLLKLFLRKWEVNIKFFSFMQKCSGSPVGKSWLLWQSSNMRLLYFFDNITVISPRSSSRSESVELTDGMWETFQFLKKTWGIRQSAQWF